MRAAYEILAWEQWSNPEGLPYQVVPAWELRSDLPDELLQQTRAALFRYDRNWDLIVEEWEDDPGPAWSTWVLLPVEGRFVALGDEVLLADGPVLLRVGGEPVEPASPRISRCFVPETFGSGSIRELPMPDRCLRNWAWGWRPTCGPVKLTVRVPLDLEALRSWFEKVEFFCYDSFRQEDDQEHEIFLPGACQGRLADAYEAQEKEGEYRLPGYDRANGYLDLFEGGFRLWRERDTVLGIQNGADNSLLRSVLAGDLGEDVQWELYDGDYGSFDAHGGSLTSLATYLDPRLPVDADPYRPGTLKLDCQEDADWEAVWRRVAAHFGVKSLDGYFLRLRAGQFPRTIQLIHQPMEGKTQLPRSPGIVWEFHVPAPEGTQAPAVTHSYTQD